MYKRQELTNTVTPKPIAPHTEPNMIAFLGDIAFLACIYTIGPTVPCPWAVSYTHLDVYKRQA